LYKRLEREYMHDVLVGYMRNFATTISATVKRGLGIAASRMTSFVRLERSSRDRVGGGGKRTARAIHDGSAEYNRNALHGAREGEMSTGCRKSSLDWPFRAALQGTIKITKAARLDRREEADAFHSRNDLLAKSEDLVASKKCKIGKRTHALL
jgi:hypothetical protein